MRAAEPLVVSALARVEVPAALWRKQRLGELSAGDARLLSQAFAADCSGRRARFAAVALGPAVLERAAELVAVHALRAYDGVQLACALAARDADPSCAAFACFDARLREAAAVEGLAPVPV